MANSRQNRAVDHDKPGHKNPATTMLEPAEEPPQGESDSDDEAPSLVQCQPVLDSACTSPPSSSFCSPAPSASGTASSIFDTPSSSSIPITILSGLLGAGKTTLLRSLLTGKLQHNLRILAIQNEFSLESGVEAPLRITPLRRTKKREKEAGVGAPKRSSSSVSSQMSHVSLREQDFEEDERKEGHEESGGEKQAVREKGYNTSSMADTKTESEDNDGDDDDGDDYLPESVYELPNGCICCSIKDELIRTLEAVLNRFPGKFDYVVVEASGVATPQQLIEAFWLDEPLQDQMHLDGIVTVIDPMNIPPLHGFCQVATSGTSRVISQRIPSSADTGTSSSLPPSASNGPSSSSQEVLFSSVSSAPPDASSQPATSSSSASSSSPPISSSRGLAVSPVLGELWVQQVICADKVLISKTDIASAEALEKTVALAKTLNPVASVLPLSFKDFKRRPGLHTSSVSEQQQKVDIREFLYLRAYARGAATADISLLQAEKVKQTRDVEALKGHKGLQEKKHSEETVEVEDDHKVAESNVTPCIRSHCISIPSYLPGSRILSSFLDGSDRRERDHPVATGGGHHFHERRIGGDSSLALDSSCHGEIQHKQRGNTTTTFGGVSCDPTLADQVDRSGRSCQKDATCLQENEVYLFSVSKLERLLSELLWREEENHGGDVSGVPSPVIYRCKGLFLAWKESDIREEEGVDNQRNESKPCGAQLHNSRLQESENRQQNSNEEVLNAEQENKRDIEMPGGRPWGVYELQGVGRTFEINSVDTACLPAMLQQEEGARGFVCKKHVSEGGGRDDLREQCDTHLPGGDTSRTQEHACCSVHACSCKSDCRNSSHQTRTQAGDSSTRQQKETDGPEVRDGGQREILGNTCCCRSADTKECQTRRILTNKFLFVGRGIDPGELSRRLRTECMRADVLDGNFVDDPARKS
ncbi:p47k family protein [Cystoisospora suis]|uniref:p47k family protein n=1 Tax=Cystoisospora suis TaxID=483139 RepID=A0A2C6KSU4_9APIC|nr:p47k family protein [Cystoisospora suis]